MGTIKTAAIQKQAAARMVATAVTVAFVLFIFSRSLYSGDASGRQSQSVLNWAQRLFGGWGPALLLTDHIIRKAAHFLEYAALGALLGITARTYVARPWEKLFLQLFLALATAAADEMLQTFVPGRSGAVADIWLDFCGAAFGCAMCLLLFYIAYRRRWEGRVLRRGGRR